MNVLDLYAVAEYGWSSHPVRGKINPGTEMAVEVVVVTEEEAAGMVGAAMVGAVADPLAMIVGNPQANPSTPAMSVSSVEREVTMLTTAEMGEVVADAG